MSTQVAVTQEHTTVVTNGSGAAAILSAGIGSFAVAIFSIAADKSAVVKDLFVFYKPTGALSGETTLAILLWLAAWAILTGDGGNEMSHCRVSTSLRLCCLDSVYC
jgi:hypothetical protein